MCNCIKSAAPFKTKCFCLNRAKSALLPAFQIFLYLFYFLCYTENKKIYTKKGRGPFCFGKLRAGVRFCGRVAFFVCARFRACGVCRFMVKGEI